MKKIILSIAFICIITITIQAQGLYFGGSLGYGLRAGSINGVKYEPNGSTDVIKYSLGTGFNPNLSAGYLFNKNMGVELGLGYLIGTKTTYQEDIILGFGSGLTRTEKANSFYLNPSFVIRAGDGKIIPYGKMGIFLGSANKEIINLTSTNSTIDIKYICKGGLSTGVTAAFGADFMMSSKFALFGEVFARLASYTPSHFTEKNTTAIGTSSTSGDFVSHTPSNYKGTNESSFISPLSAIGLNVGVKYYLFKK